MTENLPTRATCPFQWLEKRSTQMQHAVAEISLVMKWEQFLSAKPTPCHVKSLPCRKCYRLCHVQSPPSSRQCVVKRTKDKKLSNATRIYHINRSCHGEEIVLFVARCVFYTYDWISNKFVFQAHSFFDIKATISIGTEQRQWYSILVPSQKCFPLVYHTHIIQVTFNLSAAPAAPPESQALWFAQWLLQETCEQQSEVKFRLSTYITKMANILGWSFSPLFTGSQVLNAPRLLPGNICTMRWRFTARQ